MELRQGWVDLLQQRLKQNHLSYRVYNASISGDTTASGAQRLPQALAQYKPDILILELGGNDGLRGLSPTHMKQNLAGMVRMATRRNIRVLLVGMKIPPNYGRHYTQRFQAVFHEVATESGVPLVPFMLDGIATRPELMQDDGFHPNTRGQPLILENIWQYLQPLLG
jgi:acyl-CoA thioesterase-1